MATGPHLTESSLASSCSSSSKSVSVPGDHGRRHCSTTGDRISLSFDSDDESLASPDTSTRANSRAASSSNIRVSFSSALSPRFSLLQESLNNLMRPHQKSSVSFTPHWRWQQPRLRFDWQHLEENRTHEAHVTTDEVLWVVIITMGVAGMRTEILESHDVDWYVLHFFCFVRIVTSSMKYASRFNDHDLAHQVLWAAFTVGLLLLIAYLNHQRTGFGAATCLLYCLIAAAHVRVACLLPRARVFCFFAAAENLLAASIFAALALDEDALLPERALLTAHIAIEPVCALTLKLAADHAERRQLADAPPKRSRRLEFSTHDAELPRQGRLLPRSPLASCSALAAPRSYLDATAAAGAAASTDSTPAVPTSASPALPTAAPASPPASPPTSPPASPPASSPAASPALGASGALHAPCAVAIPPSLTSHLISGETTSWDIPHDPGYTIRRAEGFVMMIIVCSFLFPIGLQGKLFIASADSAACVLLGNAFALTLKLCLIDAQRMAEGDGGRLHALRRSRLHALLYLGLLPATMLGVALCGVGFVAAISGNGNSVAFPARLMCWGAALTALATALATSLHAPPNPRCAADGDSRRSAVAAWACKPGPLLGLCAALFLLPLPLGLPPVAVAGCVVLTQLLGLLGLLGLAHRSAGAAALEAWRWRVPRLQDDWRDGGGARVSSHEHFFTVLLAVAVFAINEELAASRDIEAWALLYLTFYGTLASSVRYAARFNDDDGAHKLLWGLYSFVLLLVLQGMAAKPLREGVTLFKLAACAICSLTAIGFNARAAWHDARARRVVGCLAVADLAQAALFAFACSADEAATRRLLWASASLALLCEPAIVFASQLHALASRANFERSALPRNPHYVVERLNGLLIEVLGVAVIVPNAVYPVGFAHPPLVLLGDVLAAVMAVSLKMALFDVEPVSVERHALHTSRWRGSAFLALHPLTTLALCAVGGAMSMLVPAIGAGGIAARTPFAQGLLCAGSAVQSICASLSKLLHTPKRRDVHLLKASLHAVGGAIALLPLLVPAVGDFGVLTLVVSASMLFSLAQLTLTRRHPPDAASINPQHHLMKSTPLL